MFIRLLFIFICIPAIELYVLLQIHHLIGTFPTIALILLTGVAGAYLARTQGVAILRRIAAELNAGRLPGGELLDGAMVLVGGVLLLTPGFCTDLLGFLFLAPWSRAGLKKIIRRLLQRMIERGEIHIHWP
jgi:UPF0716 protein FxsA